MVIWITVMVKINYENILEKIKKENIKLSALLLFGNEEGAILSLIKTIYYNVKQKNNMSEILYLDYKNDKNKSIKNLINNQFLFSKKNFIVINNTSEKICGELENIQFNGDILVINGEGIKANSKIKKYFDTHKLFISVPCYELKREEKIKIINTFVANNRIVLEKHAYWYLVENISNERLILEKELEKLSIYNNSSLSVNNLKMLLIQKNNTGLDDLFFTCANKNAATLIENTNYFIRSQNHSYDITRNIKRFVQILSLASANKETRNLDTLVDTYLPKYLFMQKENFKDILKKITFEKLKKMTELIQKTEILLRKNSSHYFEITQRFLLNFSKLMR